MITSRKLYAHQPIRMFSQMTTSNDQFARYPILKQFLDTGTIDIFDEGEFRSFQEVLVPLLENKTVSLSKRHYWHLFRVVAKERSYFYFLDTLLKYCKRDHGIPTDIIYDRLFEIEGKRDIRKMLDLVQEAKQNNIEFSVQLHTTILKGIVSRGSEQMLKDTMNEIKQRYPKLDVRVYAVYLEGLAK